MNEHDPRHGTARWLVYCVCGAGLLLLIGFGGVKIAQHRQLARFRELAPAMDSWRIREMFGKPDRTWGSGILRYEYDIIGGEVVTITFFGLQPSLITYDGEVLFERNFPPPVDTVTIPLSSKPMPISDAGQRTLQTNPPPKRAVPEP